MSQSEEHDVDDVHTRVTHSHHYEPIRNGESERFRTEVIPLFLRGPQTKTVVELDYPKATWRVEPHRKENKRSISDGSQSFGGVRYISY